MTCQCLLPLFLVPFALLHCSGFFLNVTCLVGMGDRSTGLRHSCGAETKTFVCCRKFFVELTCGYFVLPEGAMKNCSVSYC